MLVLTSACNHPSFGSQRQEKRSVLNLQATRRDDQILLTWDPVETATSATLSIRDGGRSEEVELYLPAYRAGSVLYTPYGNDVNLTLDVRTSKSATPLEESVRVLGGKRPVVLEVQSNEAPVVVEQRTIPVPSTVRELVLPVERSRTSSSSTGAVAEPPALEARLSTAGPGFLPAASAGAAPPPSPAPNPTSNQGPKPAALQVRQMKILRRTPPMYPPLARQAHVGGTVVVEARVGPDGRVRHAEAVSGAQMLRWVAANAVKQWLFEPANVNGERVEATTRVEVVFAP